jgi:hypothetical protein
MTFGTCVYFGIFGVTQVVYDHENDDREHDYHVPIDVDDHHRVCQTRMTLTPMLMTAMAMGMMLIIVDVC